MGLIIYDGITLVIDRTAVEGEHRWLGTNVWRGHANEVLAGIGDRVLLDRMHDWYMEGQDPAKYPEAQKKRGACVFIAADAAGFFRYGKSPSPIKYGRHFCAFGLGAPYAIGALEMGAYAIEAAEIALKHAGKSSLGLTAIALEEKTSVNRRDLN